MKEYLFSVISGACVLTFVYELLPINENGALKKYTGYMLSLIFVIVLFTPFAKGLDISYDGIVDLFESASLPTSVSEVYSGMIYYDTDGRVYACTEQTEPEREREVYADIFVVKCIENVVACLKDALCVRFDIDDIDIAAAVDARSRDNIDFVCFDINVTGVGKYILSDIKKYAADISGSSVNVTGGEKYG